MKTKEIFWKEIEGYSRYEVSTDGRVRNAKTWELKKCNINASTNYPMQVLVGDDGKIHNEYVHRLVAKAFIDNPNNYRCVIHKNHKKDDNRVDNLEWAERAITVKPKKKNYFTYLVKQKLLNDCVIAFYRDFADLEKMGFRKESILRAARNKYKQDGKTFCDTYKGYKWECVRQLRKDFEKTIQ